MVGTTIHKVAQNTISAIILSIVVRLRKILCIYACTTKQKRAAHKKAYIPKAAITKSKLLKRVATKHNWKKFIVIKVEKLITNQFIPQKYIKLSYHAITFFIKNPKSSMLQIILDIKIP